MFFPHELEADRLERCVILTQHFAQIKTPVGKIHPVKPPCRRDI